MSEQSLTRRHVIAGALAGASFAPLGAFAQTPRDRRPRFIMDAQTHIWSGGKPSPTHRQEPFLVTDLLQQLDGAGVNRAIIVTPSWNPNGNELPLEAAKTYPDRLAVMGLYDTNSKPDVAQIQAWKSRQGMLGLRLFLGSPQGKAWFTDVSSDWLWPELQRNQIPLMLFAGGMMPDVAKIAAKYPDLKICLDSFGAPAGVVGVQAFDNYDQVLALAKFKNVSIKPVSLPFISGEAYPYRNLHPFIRRIYDAFGPERIFWGSDITLLKSPYSDCVKAFTQDMDWLSDQDLELIMGRALSKWINWPAPV